MAESRKEVYFDPDLYPDNTLKKFKLFIQAFELRYEAVHPDPPKVSMDVSIERWKLEHEDCKPNLQEYDHIREKWQTRDKVAKILGMHSSSRLYSDWQVAVHDETTRKAADFKTFVDKMVEYYKPTENFTLKHFQFRSLAQNKGESFSSFCNRVEKEAQDCEFKCISADCNAEKIAVRDQIVIGLRQDDIRQDALKHSWDLSNLRSNGRRMESAAKGSAEISGELEVNKMGKYTYKNIKTNKNYSPQQKKPIICYFCGTTVHTSIVKHVEQCPAKKVSVEIVTEWGIMQ